MCGVAEAEGPTLRSFLGSFPHSVSSPSERGDKGRWAGVINHQPSCTCLALSLSLPVLYERSKNAFHVDMVVDVTSALVLLHASQTYRYRDMTCASLRSSPHGRGQKQYSAVDRPCAHRAVLCNTVLYGDGQQRPRWRADSTRAEQKKERSHLSCPRRAPHSPLNSNLSQGKMMKWA